MNMPGIVGPVQLVRTSNGGVVGLGDRIFISPVSSNNTYGGSGILSTANFATLENLFDINTDFAPSAVSEPTIINN